MVRADATQSEETVWLKRQALQIVMQLPDDQREALRVLGFARELVTEYLAEKGPQESAEIIRFGQRGESFF